MADPFHLSLLKQGASAWNQWRAQNRDVKPDLVDADLSSLNLSGAELTRGDLRGSKFHETNLAGVNLREADLQGADLSGALGGLKTEQLGGADLTGAKLPEPLAELFKKLDAVKGISDSAQKLFVGMLGACLYSWLTIGTTTDVSLITDRASSPLPIIQASIPIVGFYVIAPVLLLGVYFYFHFYLQKLWEELGSLPAIFPDGRPLQAKADPWLLSDLVRSHFYKLSQDRPLISHIQKWISVLLAWWLVPVTLLLFWARYLPRHDYWGTGFHTATLAISITAAVFWHRLSGETLRGRERRPFVWQSAVARPKAYTPLIVTLALAGFFIVFAIGVISGTRSSKWDHDWWRETTGPRTWAPHLLQTFHFSPFANLRGADLSVKPANWTGKGDSDAEAVSGAQMNGVDLREADLTNAFLVGALLNDAHFEGADLLSADLRNAELVDAHLERADLLGARLDGVTAEHIHLANTDLHAAHLNGARLRAADLSGADLTGADLTDADIEYAQFGGATIAPDQLLNAKNWKSAYFDRKLLEALSLPPDNNDVVHANEKKEQDAAARNPSAAELARIDRFAKLIPGGNREAENIRALIVKHLDGGTQVETIPVAPSVPGPSPAGSSPVPFSVAQVERLYNFPPNLDGRGQTIGIIELGGGYRDSDLNLYFAQAKIPKPTIISVGVSGAKNSPDTGQYANSQVELDLEIAGSVAPKAQLVVYFAPNTAAGYLEAITTAAHDSEHHPSVILIGWGGPESSWQAQSLQAMNQQLGTAAGAGITVVTGSGDNGASDGVSDGRRHVDFPASSPWVLAVGGTKLIARGSTIASEVVWNDGPGSGATGGGVSDIFSRPEWQSGIRIPPEAGAKPGRAVPDVSANASPLTGYRIVIDGKVAAIGGTSASAPLWAGLIALLNQGLGHNLGYLNPVLYRQLGDKGVFHEITSGNNSSGNVKGYSAGPGWNAAAGWGTPDGTKLLAALRELAGK